MQELIQAEITETAHETAEKHGCKPHLSRQHASAPFQASDEDDEDDRSFMESLGESSEDDEHDAVVNNAEVSSTLFPLRLNILISYLKLAKSLLSKTIPLAQKKKSRHRKNDAKQKRSKSPANDAIKDASTPKKPWCQSVTIKEVEDEDAPRPSMQVVHG
jgi:hypothetical protein